MIQYYFFLRVGMCERVRWGELICLHGLCLEGNILL